MQTYQWFSIGCSTLAILMSAYALLHKQIEYRFKKRDYTKISNDGSWVIVHTGHEHDFLDDETEYKIERVRMTEKEFDSLAEFDGF